MPCVNWIRLCWSQGPFAQNTVSVRAVCAGVRLFLAALVCVALVQQTEFVHKQPISTVNMTSTDHGGPTEGAPYPGLEVWGRVNPIPIVLLSCA